MTAVDHELSLTSCCSLSAYGYFLCQFNDATLCGMQKDTTTDFMFYFTNKSAPNYPTSGPGGDKTGNAAGGYVYINSKDTAVGSIYMFLSSHGWSCN